MRSPFMLMMTLCPPSLYMDTNFVRCATTSWSARKETRQLSQLASWLDEQSKAQTQHA